MLSLGVTATASVTGASTQIKSFGWETVVLIISNEEMKGILEIVKHLGESSLLVKGVNKITENEAKEKKVDFFPFY